MTKDIFFKTDILEQYLTGKITATRAAKMLHVSERYIWKIIKKYKEQGKISLIHNLSNKPSNHSIDKELKERVLDIIKEKYYDFNPTLAAECLLKYEKINIKANTLGVWMRKEHLQSKLRKRKPSPMT